MRRCVVLIGLMAAALASQGMMWFGCAPRSAAKRVEIRKVKDNLYVVEGGGGNTAVFVTEAGVVLVDSKLPGWGPVLLEKIRSVTDKPITTIIDTHTHRDHAGGNAFFGPAVEIVAQANTKANLEADGVSAAALPGRTFTDRLSLMSGHDRIDLYYFGPGHTNGDAIVVFPAARAAHTGDLFAGKALPIIEAMHGGSGLAYPETLSKAYAGIDNVDTIITGHGGVVTWNDLKDFASFNAEFLEWTRTQLSEGRSAEDAADRYRLPQRYKGYYTDTARIRTNIETIYSELRKGAPRPIRWWGGV